MAPDTSYHWVIYDSVSGGYVGGAGTFSRCDLLQEIGFFGNVRRVGNGAGAIAIWTKLKMRREACNQINGYIFKLQAC